MDKGAVGRFLKVLFKERPRIVVAGYLVHGLADAIANTSVYGIMFSTTPINHVAEM